MNALWFAKCGSSSLRLIYKIRFQHLDTELVLFVFHIEEILRTALKDFKKCISIVPCAHKFNKCICIDFNIQAFK